MATQWPVEIPRRVHVADSPERSVALKIPAAISDRLDSLVKKVEVVRTVDGEKRVERGTSRKELVAALIYDAPARKHDLNRKLERYRGARVASTVLGQRSAKRVVLRGHRPGPRPTSADPNA
jgi:hypothetical protein